MIVEIRTYRIRSGQRERFLEFFRTKAVPAQQAHGMSILGPFVDCEQDDTFHWMRAFPSHAERERIKHAFYEGEPWKSELEHIALPMLESYTVAVTEINDGFCNDFQEVGI